MLQDLDNEGIFMNIRGKNKIKQLMPHALPRLRKGEGYEMSKKGGILFRSQITEDLEPPTR